MCVIKNNFILHAAKKAFAVNKNISVDLESKWESV